MIGLMLSTEQSYMAVELTMMFRAWIDSLIAAGLGFPLLQLSATMFRVRFDIGAVEWLGVFGIFAGVCIAQRLSGLSISNIAVFFVAILVGLLLLLVTS